ncbi:hypothetical protein BKA66DRAFT_453093 [Pyrenochaeta sp. MPI-SDFR-AT-0127]|nr:hypothetical protein BKA66DRAFT_453093 [Pyrenochaeta sp. MPI-SDFR-AT-0127]
MMLISWAITFGWCRSFALCKRECHSVPHDSSDAFVLLTSNLIQISKLILVRLLMWLFLLGRAVRLQGLVGVPHITLALFQSLFHM